MYLPPSHRGQCCLPHSCSVLFSPPFDLFQTSKIEMLQYTLPLGFFQGTKIRDVTLERVLKLQNTDTTTLYAPLLLAIFTFTTATYYWASRKVCSELRIHSAMDAMISVFPPARFSHPRHFATLVKYSVHSKSSTIFVDAPQLLLRLTSGDIEPKDDQVLVDLLRDRLQAYGWKIILSFDWWWKWVSIIYLVKAAFSGAYLYSYVVLSEVNRLF